jgi:hypothetical protein
MLLRSKFVNCEISNKKVMGDGISPPPARAIELRSMTGSETRFLTRLSRSYAALLGPLPSDLASMDLSEPTFTLICLGLASAFLGRLIFNTPLS